MKFVLRTLISLLLLLAVGAYAHTPVSANCTINSCSPVFATDSALNNRITSLTQASTTSFQESTVFFGFPATCTRPIDLTMRYCWYEGVSCDLTHSDVTNSGTVTSQGTSYLIGEVAQSELSRAASNQNFPVLNVNLWTGSQFACQGTSIPIQRIQASCSVTANPSRNPDGSYQVPLTVNATGLVPGRTYSLVLGTPGNLDVVNSRSTSFTVQSGSPTVNLGFSDVRVNAGNYVACVLPSNNVDIITCASQICQQNPVTLDASLPLTEDPTFATPAPVTGGSTNSAQAPFNLCQQAANAEELAACQACVGGSTITDPNSQHFWTAFGCVRTSKEGLIQDFLRIGLGLAGGFVLLSILYGSFLLTTSSGDPKRVQEGQEMISSAVMGLLFVIFSVVILQFIGVSILRIPGFGG